MNEQFSAFLDGEATRDETDSVINALLRDEALRASWGRQHWLRTTLRAHSSEATVALDADFSARVMRAIAADDKPETTVAPAPRARRHRRRWYSVAGLAVAASATGIVLFVSNPLRPGARDQANLARNAPAVRAQEPAGSLRVFNSPSLATTRGVASAQTVPAAVGSHARTKRADRWSVSDPALADELNGYLVEHNGLARGYGLSGTTPALVQVATYGQEVPQ
jgi:negative regulator of sigma E activity